MQQQEDKYAPGTITVDSKCNWTVTPEPITVYKSADDTTKFNKIEWTINGVANDVIVIVIANGGCFEDGKRNVYTVVLDGEGKGTIKTKKLKDVDVPSEWKYAIIRIANDAKEHCFKDPRISVQG